MRCKARWEAAAAAAPPLAPGDEGWITLLPPPARNAGGGSNYPTCPIPASVVPTDFPDGRTTVAVLRAYTRVRPGQVVASFPATLIKGRPTVLTGFALAWRAAGADRAKDVVLAVEHDPLARGVRTKAAFAIWIAARDGDGEAVEGALAPWTRAAGEPDPQPLMAPIGLEAASMWVRLRYAPARFGAADAVKALGLSIGAAVDVHVREHGPCVGSRGRDRGVVRARVEEAVRPMRVDRRRPLRFQFTEEQNPWPDVPPSNEGTFWFWLERSPVDAIGVAPRHVELHYDFEPAAPASPAPAPADVRRSACARTKRKLPDA